MQKERLFAFALIVASALAVTPLLEAAPFTSGNTLTFDGTRVREYTSHRVLVQEISVPIPVLPNFRDMIDGVVDRMGRLHVFNVSDAGSFASTYDPTTNIWTHNPMPEYPTLFGSQDIGDVGIYGDYLFFGLVRIDLRDLSHQLFSTSVFGASTSSIGRDGLLYVAQAGSPAYQVAVLDPITLKELRVVELHSDIYQDSRIHVTGITANRLGELFVTDINGVIFHFDANGQQIAWTQPTPFHSSLLDIDLSDDGQIVVGYRLDAVLFTDSTLMNYDSVGLSLDAPHVAFVQRPVPVPEPSTLISCGVGAAICLFGLGVKRQNSRRAALP